MLLFEDQLKVVRNIIVFHIVLLLSICAESVLEVHVCIFLFRTVILFRVSGWEISLTLIILSR